MKTKRRNQPIRQRQKTSESKEIDRLFKVSNSYKLEQNRREEREKKGSNNVGVDFEFNKVYIS